MDRFGAFHWIDDKVHRKAIFTKHVLDEMYAHNKNQIFVLDVIQKGEKKLISKREQKFESHLPIGKVEWIVSFSRKEHNYVVLIHFAPKKR
jgi:hypothetical protein